MRYVAMQLRLALAEKFPDASEDEILKVYISVVYVCLNFLLNKRFVGCRKPYLLSVYESSHCSS